MICRLFAQQYKAQQLGAELIKLLGCGDYDRLTVVVAFLRSEGLEQLENVLRKFIETGGKCLFIVGISSRVTSYEGLKLLLDIVKEGAITIFCNQNSAAGIFHPKLYFFEGGKKVAIVIASNNLTKPGLYNNYELATIIEIDPQDENEQKLQAEVSSYINELTANGGVARELTTKFLETLRETGALQIETKEPKSEEEAEEEAAARLERTARQARIKGLFGSAPVTAAPPSKKKPQPKASPQTSPGTSSHAASKASDKLIMRAYASRAGTQVQVPIPAVSYFKGVSRITSAHSKMIRAIHPARAHGKQNTIKLEIRECKNLEIPILVFERAGKNIVYTALEGTSGKGAELLKRLEKGRTDGSTKQTRSGSTLYRFE